VPEPRPSAYKLARAHVLAHSHPLHVEVGATPQLVTHFCTALDVYITNILFSPQVTRIYKQFGSLVTTFMT